MPLTAHCHGSYRLGMVQQPGFVRLPEEPSWFRRNARWISTIGIFAILAFGFTMIQVDEYAVAILVWAVAALVSVGRATPWSSMPYSKTKTAIFRGSWIFGTLGAVAVLVVWTIDKKSEKSWTNLSWFKNGQPALSAGEVDVHDEIIGGWPK